MRADVPAATPRVFCACGYVQQNGVHPGLGDYVAAGLQKVGITKQRVSKVTKRPCGCGRRQKKLNELGRKIGIG
jgi:hypothetical protein